MNRQKKEEYKRQQERWRNMFGLSDVVSEAIKKAENEYDSKSKKDDLSQYTERAKEYFQKQKSAAPKTEQKSLAQSSSTPTNSTQLLSMKSTSEESTC